MKRLAVLARSILFATVTGAVATSSLLAQNLTWLQVNTSGPPNRCCHAMAHDIKRQRTVLFGGWNGSAVMGDTWEWDGRNWTQRKPKTIPTARCCQAMAYDSGRGRTIMFGGASGAGAAIDLADTWEWDGTDWTRINTKNSPKPRRSPMLTHHLTMGKMLLFGGGTGGSGAPYFAGTWTYDGKDWTQLTPKNSPTARWGSGFAFQLLRGKTLLFGGRGVGGNVSDTWEWDGKDWIKLNPKNSPSPRWLMGSAYSLNHRRVFMFGGRTANQETWEWDGTDWTRTKVAVSPRGRSDMAVAYDIGRNVITLFGGLATGAGFVGDTWELGADPMASYTSLGKGCQGSAGVPSLTAMSSGPIIGKRFDVRVTNIPAKTSTILLLFGLSKTQWGSTKLPWDMSVVGMSGCTLYASADIMLFLGNSNGTATAGFTVPNDNNLIHLAYFNQAYVPDATLGPFGASMSNAAEAKIGSR